MNTKTRFEWQLHVNYGHGWEHEISEDSRRDALKRQREYKDNYPEYPTKVVMRKVKVAP